MLDHTPRGIPLADASPAPEAPNDPPAPRRWEERRPLTMDDVAQGFVAAFEPVPVSPMYQLGVFVTAAVLLLTPLLYLGIIALLGYGVYWHAVTNVPRAGRSGSGVMLLYVGPLIAGAIVVLFLLKPLFAPRAKMWEPYTVQPDEEPLFTKYVHTVCKVMGAPVPTRIDVDAQANASASFRRGFLSMFSNDLVLTIGLPLVSGMNLRELTGVLAHELGHFRQGAAMRLTYVVHRINAWFARAAYERDAWDEYLARSAAQSRLGWAVLIVLMAQAGVWLGRLVLKGLMYFAHGVSCFMSRQMEFDADRCEAQMAGSEVFATTSRKVVRLGAAAALSHNQLYTRWTERQLPDNLPDFIAARAEKLPKELEDELKKELERRRAKLFETHPPTALRIEAAAALNLPGNFRLEVPARALFNDFRGVCTKASYIHYRGLVGKDIMQVTFVPTEQVLTQQRTEDASSDSMERFFPVPLPMVRPIFTDVLQIARPRDAKEALEDLKDARRELEYRFSEFKDPAVRFIKAADRLHALRVALDLAYAGIKVRDPALGIPSATKEAIKAEIPGAETARSAAEEALAPAVAAARKRILAALSLLLVPGVDKRLPEAGAFRARLAPLLDAMIGLKEAYPVTRRIREKMDALVTLLHNYKGNERNDIYLAQLREVGIDLHRHIQEIFSATSSAEYPFSNKRGAGTIADMLKTGVPADEATPVELLQNAEAVLEGYFSVYYRALGEMVMMAERMEQTLKLPPIATAQMDPEEIFGGAGGKRKKKEKGKKGGAEQEGKDSPQPMPV